MNEQDLGILTDVHHFLVVHLFDSLPSLPNNLRCCPDVRLLVVGIHKVKQVASKILVDEGSFLFVFVNVQSQATAAREAGVELLTLLVCVVRHALQNERLAFASGFAPELARRYFFLVMGKPS